MKEGSTTAYLQPIPDTLQSIFKNGYEKTFLAALTTFASSFVHDHSASLLILLGLCVIDWITGVVSALKSRSFRSSRFRAGILKVFVYVLLVVAFHLLGFLHPVLDKVELDHYVIMYLSVTEALSIIENTQSITGFSLPEWIKQLLKALGRHK